MILIVFKYLIPKGSRGLIFYPFVFSADKDEKLNQVFINHERILIRQWLELLIFPFYLWYFMEYLFRLIQYINKFIAFKNISFERESYANVKDFDYL
jgi:hypothetical protein